MSRNAKGRDDTPTIPAVPAARRRPAKVLPRETYEAVRDARAVREETERVATEAIADAHAEADAIRREAARIGREEGLAEATATLVRAEVERALVLAEMEPALAALAVEIAQRLVDRAIDLDPGLVASLCARALERARGGRDIVLEVSTADVPHVEAARADLEAVLGQPGAFAVRASEAVERGGCVVESSLGRVDARLSTQLAAIRAAIDAAR